eukprot:COSAG02_NODE_1521_length_12162_cov_3.464147_19_plen_43_part_00
MCVEGGEIVFRISCPVSFGPEVGDWSSDWVGYDVNGRERHTG